MGHSPKETEGAPPKAEVDTTGRRAIADPEAPTLAGVGSSHDSMRSGPRGPSEAELVPGEMLDGHFRVTRRIGGGGMGSVYEVEHVELGKRFAAKVVLAVREEDEGAMLRLRNEARTLSSLDHENIVGVTHLGRTDQGRVFVIMELLEGGDLASRLRAQKRAAAQGDAEPWLADEEVDRVVRQTLEALGAAHQAEVVHRDLKPENLFLAKKRSGVVVKVVDFGISKIRREREDVSLTRPGQILGTPLYMAPEQARSTTQVDGRADLYSLGCILYEMITGRPPFDDSANAYDCVVMHATRRPDAPSVHRPGLPPSMDAFILRALEKDPADRFESADAMRAAWDAARVEAGLPVSARDTDPFRTTTSGTDLSVPSMAPPPPTAGTPGARRWLPMAAVLVLAAVAGAWWMGGMGGMGGDKAPVAAMAVPVDPPPVAPEPVAPEPAVEEPEADDGAEAEIDEGPVEPPAPPAPEVLKKHIVSVPRGARVWVDGEVVGTTPLTIEVTAGEAPRSLRVARRGYDTVERELGPDDPEEISVRLRRSRRGVLPLAPR
jgi:eukaryotic-like serine/threonine-protein kinase